MENILTYTPVDLSASRTSNQVPRTGTPVEIELSGTLVSSSGSRPIELSDPERAFEFHSNLQYWNNTAGFLSVNNYDNSYFRAIVNMGEAAVPYIKKELEKGPTSLVYALDMIYPGRVRFNGFVSLKRACAVWLRVLSQ